MILFAYTYVMNQAIILLRDVAKFAQSILVTKGHRSYNYFFVFVFLDGEWFLQFRSRYILYYNCLRFNKITVDQSFVLCS